MKYVLVVLLGVAAFAAGQSPQERRIDRSPDGTPLDPVVAFKKRVERQEADKRFEALKADATEMAELSRKVREDIESGGQNVISVRVFERLDRIEKLVKKVRNAAKE